MLYHVSFIINELKENGVLSRGFYRKVSVTECKI